MKISPRQRLIREMILHLKKGYLDAAYFQSKFGVDIIDEWRDEWSGFQEEGLLTVDEDARPH